MRHLGKGGLNPGGLFQPKPFRDSTTATLPPAQDCCSSRIPIFLTPRPGGARRAVLVWLPRPLCQLRGHSRRDATPRLGTLVSGMAQQMAPAPALPADPTRARSPKGHCIHQGKVESGQSPAAPTENKVTNPLNSDAKQHLIIFKS